jgi:uncharacterized Tic20 family protein
MISITDRLENARKNRKEEQVIAAILHMSSPWGFFALITSGVVWVTTKSRSRFLSVQALQAFLFQLTSFLAFILMFLIFMAGFYFAGITNPELTQNLIIAMIIGFASIFFFQFIFPLWGIVAGIQILRGNNFQYPVLGKLAIRWTSRQPFVVNSEASEHRLSSSNDGHILAGIAHITIIAGLSLLLSPILWATDKNHSRFLSHNLIQACLFQMAATAILAFAYFAVWGSGMVIGALQFFGVTSPEFMNSISEFARITNFPFSFGIVFVLLALISGIYVIVATIQTFRHKEFHYPLIGRWLLHYIQ